MVLAEHLLTVFLVSVLTSGVRSSEQSCLPVPPESSNGSEHQFRRDSTWSRKEKTTGCICYFKYCIPLCCPDRLAASVDGCVKDELTDSAVRFEPDSKEIHSTIGNPCASIWKDSESLTNGSYNNSQDVLDYIKRFNGSLLSDDFCLLRKPSSTNFTVLVCKNHHGSGSEDVWALVCSSVTILFKLTTFIVYIVVPELNRNLQGWIILSFLASDIGNTSLIILNLVLLRRIHLSENLYVAMGFVANVCGFAYIMWLNVMSFDIWKKFRRIRSSRDGDIVKRRKTTYFRYSVYVWGTSIVDATINLFCLNLPLTSYDALQKKSRRLYLFGVPGVIVFVSNTIFYTMTAFRIMQWKKETAHMIHGVNKHHRRNQQLFNLNLKLFIMSGYPMILWAIAYFWDNDVFGLFVHSTEILQGLFIFLIFVWKDDVKDSIRKLFSSMLHRLGSRFRHNSLPASGI